MRRRIFTRENLPKITLTFILLVFVYTILFYHKYTVNEGKRRGVIKWDVISYYGYLPATFIYGDVTLEFIGDGSFKNDNKFWYTKLDNGKRLIVTSMGLSYLYAPFFFAAHGLAPLVDQAQDGYSNIYQLMLVMSGLFYSILGLILLARFLRSHFDPVVTSVVVLVVGLGTNLYYYSTLEAAMPHSHNFFLVTLFMIMVVRWYRNPAWYNAVFTGVVFGLVVLVRPTNILLFFFLLLYGVKNLAGFGDRVRFYLQKWPLLLLMTAVFFIPWIPQFLYWKEMSGQFLFFSYGAKEASFDFARPHILQALFSFRKGWLIYTPVMLFALAGFPVLYRRARGWFYALTIYVVAMIYVLSSWWSWWYGGGFGLRAFIAMYPLLAFPMAMLLHELRSRTRKKTFVVVTAAMLILTLYQVFQTRQFVTQAIHYSGTTARSYFENFLKFRPTPASWKMLELPDYNLARLGIHVTYSTGRDVEAWRAMEKEEALDKIRREIKADPRVEKQIRRYAEDAEISPDSAMNHVLQRMYERKTQ